MNYNSKSQGSKRQSRLLCDTSLFASVITVHFGYLTNVQHVFVTIFRMEDVGVTVVESTEQITDSNILYHTDPNHIDQAILILLREYCMDPANQTCLDPCLDALDQGVQVVDLSMMAEK